MPGARAVVERGLTIHTNVVKSYLGLSNTYTHETVDHAVRVRSGQVHTNNVKNFWSLLKCNLKDTYFGVTPKGARFH